MLRLVAVKAWIIISCLLFLIGSSLSKVQSSSTIIGLVTSDSVIIGSNRGYMLNGVEMDSNFEWLNNVGDHVVVALEGDASDCEYIKSELEAFQRDHYLKFNSDVSCSVLAHYFRQKIAETLRSSTPLQLNALIAGWDKIHNKPQLYYLDSIGSIQNVDYSTHGKYTPFVLSILDQYINKNVTSKAKIKSAEEIIDGIEIMNKCWKEIKKRSVTSLNSWIIKTIDSKGIQQQIIN